MIALYVSSSISEELKFNASVITCPTSYFFPPTLTFSSRNEAVNSNKVICAICAAPRILGEKGLLKGKNAVCYPGFEQYLDGANVVDAGCVRDGNIITSKGMGKATEFSLSLIEALKDKDTAEKIRNSIFA